MVSGQSTTRFMKLNLTKLEKALKEFQENSKKYPRVETSDDWAEEWWCGLWKKYGCDPWEKWDAEADELEREELNGCVGERLKPETC